MSSVWRLGPASQKCLLARPPRQHSAHCTAKSEKQMGVAATGYGGPRTTSIVCLKIYPSPPPPSSDSAPASRRPSVTLPPLSPHSVPPSHIVPQGHVVPTGHLNKSTPPTAPSRLSSPSGLLPAGVARIGDCSPLRPGEATAAAAAAEGGDATPPALKVTSSDIGDRFTLRPDEAAAAEDAPAPMAAEGPEGSACAPKDTPAPAPMAAAAGVAAASFCIPTGGAALAAPPEEEEGSGVARPHVPFPMGRGAVGADCRPSPPCCGGRATPCPPPAAAARPSAA